MDLGERAAGLAMMVEVAAARTTTVLGPAHDDTKNAVRNVATWSGRWCEAARFKTNRSSFRSIDTIASPLLVLTRSLTRSLVPWLALAPTHFTRTFDILHPIRSKRLLLLIHNSSFNYRIHHFEYRLHHFECNFQHV